MNGDDVVERLRRKQVERQTTEEEVAVESIRSWRSQMYQLVDQAQREVPRLLEEADDDQLTLVSLSHAEQKGVFRKQQVFVKDDFAGWSLATFKEYVMGSWLDSELFLLHDGRLLMCHVSRPIGGDDATYSSPRFLVDRELLLRMDPSENHEFRFWHIPSEQVADSLNHLLSLIDIRMEVPRPPPDAVYCEYFSVAMSDGR